MTYEDSTVMFSPNGGLTQIEYAQKASDHGSLVTFSIENENIFLFIERKNINPLIIENENKFSKVDENIYMSFSGLSPDADVLISKARVIARNFKLRTSEDINVEILAEEMGDYVQSHTIEGSKRPFGVRLLFLGFYNGPRAFIVESDGNCIEYRAGAIGAKSDEAIPILEKETENRAYKAICNFVKDTKGLIKGYNITSTNIEILDL